MGVEGLSDIEHRLQSFTTTFKGEVRKAVVDGALRIERDAKKLCPVDTGTLRRSITHAQKPSQDGVRVDIGTNIEYAADVEFGSNKEWSHYVRRCKNLMMSDVIRQELGRMENAGASTSSLLAMDTASNFNPNGRAFRDKIVEKKGTRIKVNHKRKIAKPYMFPAFTMNAPKVQIDIKDAFNRAVSGYSKGGV